MLYPFSGPDFFNAYAFFPDHSRYVFFSLERPGSLPDLESVTLVQFTKLLQDVRSAFRDIFERNYFITSYMTKQLTTPWIRGTVPVMAIDDGADESAHRENRAAGSFSGSYPSLRYAGRQTAARVDARACASSSPIQTATGTQQLYYFRLDATDKALEFYPDFLTWVSQYKPATVI